MILPNFVIIGAPKCGTSFLFSWLAMHPHVCASKVKEPFFLMDSDYPFQGKPGYYQGGLASYDAVFPRGALNYRVRMEGTTHYFYQKTALRVLSEIPDVRICVVLREPAERIYSSFQFTKHNLCQIRGNIDFSQFLGLLDKNEPLYPNYCDSPESAYVLEHDIENSRYARHLMPWLAVMGTKRLKVVLFDDLISRPREVLEDICGWLDLNPALLPTVSGPRNQTIRVRLRYLHRLVLYINSLRLFDPVKPYLKDLYLRFQGNDNSTESYPYDSILKLRHRFASEVAEVEKLLGRDLNSWHPMPLSRRE